MMYNIHFRNEFGGEWSVSHNFYQLARLDHVVGKLPQMRSIYYPLVSRDTLDRIKSVSDARERVAKAEHFRTLLERWMRAVIECCHFLDEEENSIVERFFQLPFPSEDTKTYQFTTISKFDNGKTVDDMAWELKSAYSAKTSHTRATTMSKSSMRSISQNSSQRNWSKEGDSSPGRKGAASQDSPSASSIESDIVLKTNVRRGLEVEGVLEYDVMLSVSGKRPRVVKRRYSLFRKLYFRLMDLKVSMLVPFPSKGVGSVEDEDFLSKRTYYLDAWFREVCTQYKYWQQEPQQALKEFLDFDLKRTGFDSYLHDKLANGEIEAPRAPIADTKTALTRSDDDVDKSIKKKESDLFFPSMLSMTGEDEGGVEEERAASEKKWRLWGKSSNNDSEKVRNVRVYHVIECVDLSRIREEDKNGGRSLAPIVEGYEESFSNSVKNPISVMDLSDVALTSILDDKFITQPLEDNKTRSRRSSKYKKSSRCRVWGCSVM